MSASQPSIHVNQVDLAHEVTHDQVVRAVAAVLKAERTTSGEVSVTFVEPADIAALNQRHRGRVGPTDVLAFQLGESDSPLGDIYICPARARESARDYSIEPREELLRLVVHGTLHVLGHQHPEGPDRESSAMFRRQEEILARLL